MANLSHTAPEWGTGCISGCGSFVTLGAGGARLVLFCTLVSIVSKLEELRLQTWGNDDTMSSTNQVAIYFSQLCLDAVGRVIEPGQALFSLRGQPLQIRNNLLQHTPGRRYGAGPLWQQQGPHQPSALLCPPPTPVDEKKEGTNEVYVSINQVYTDTGVGARKVSGPPSDAHSCSAKTFSAE